MSEELATFDAELTRRLEELERERLKPFNRDALTWLAVVPRWSEELATVAGFPSGEEKIADFARRAEHAGLSETAAAPDRDGGTQLHFWMPDSAKTLVLGQLDPGELQYQLPRVAKAVQGAVARGAFAGPAVVAWADAAGTVADPSLSGGDALNDQIQNLADRGETGRALDVIEAATSLATVVGGEFTSIAARGTRRIALEYRRAHNERALKTFLPRKEQIDAFDLLLKGSDDDWALHYVGIGGVGKTMLVRYLTTRFGPETGRGSFPVARIDFDHVSPMYPGERPGQLVLELADELAAHAGSRRRDRLLGNVVDTVTSLHEAARQNRAPVEVSSPEFLRAIDAFAAFIRALPQPVVFFFDTCEELARFHPPGEEAPGITATFSMLHQLWERHAGLRVVFAGRRLLAAGSPALREVEPTSVSTVERPYLSVHEIRGFTRREALDYLTNVRRCSGVRSDLLDAVLGCSLELARIHRHSATARPDDEERYNPYDLAFNADVLEERPELDADTVRARGADLYIQLRIIERLAGDPELVASLPAAVLLGRFDRAMLECVRDAPSGELFERIAEQEWSEESADQELDAVFLSVQPRLRERLDQHYERTDPLRYAEIRRAVGVGLRGLIASQPLRRLRSDHFLAALRFLEPAEAARLWTETAERICEEEAWAWSRNVCTVLLSDEGPAGSPASPLRAGVQASLIGALLHEGRPFDAAAYWRVVQQSAHAYGEDAARDELWTRSALGLLVGALRSGALPSSEDISLLTSIVIRPQCRTGSGAGASAAALEALLDHSPQAPVAEAVAQWASEIVPSEGVLAAYAALLAARCLARVDHADKSATWFLRADLLAAGASPAQAWNDWVAPSDIRSRITLEAVRVGAKRPTRGDMAAWVDEVKDRLNDIEAERLTSALLTLELEEQPIDAERLDSLERLDVYDPGRQPLCAAHRATPPLCVSLARGWLACGAADRALALLERREREALGSRVDPGTVTAAHLEIVEAARRTRESGRFESLIRRYAVEPPATTPDTEAVRGAAREAVALLGIRIASPGNDSCDVHSWWRTLSIQSPAEARAALADARLRILPAAALDAAEVHLDLCEARLVALRFGESDRALSLPTLEGSFSYTADGVLRRFEGADAMQRIWRSAHTWERSGRHESPPHRWARLALRAVALSGEARPDGPRPPAELESIPPRLLAELALEEGELMALRAPAQAARLLRLAGERFRRVGDTCGRMMSGVLAVGSLLDAGDTGSASKLWHEHAVPAYEDWRGALLDARPWAGWVRRFGDCAARLEAKAVGPVETEASVDVEARASASGVAVASVEGPMAAVPSLEPAQESVAGLRVPALRSAPAWCLRWLRRRVPTLLGGLIGIGLIVGLGELVNLALKAINPSLNQGLMGGIFLALLLIAGLVWLVRLSEATRRYLLARWFTLHVSVESQLDGTGVLSALLLLRPALWRLPILVANAIAWVVVPSGARPLRPGVRGQAIHLDDDAAPLSLSLSLSLPLVALARFARGARLGVELRVTQSLAGVPWERKLSGLARGNDEELTELPSAFAIRRRVFTASVPPPLAPVAAAAVGIVSPPASASFVESLWRRGFRGDWTGSARVKQIEPSTGRVPTVGLLHLIGIPTYTPTTGEWQLRIDAGTSAAELTTRLSESVPGSQQLVSPDRLPAQARHLVVVEDEPTSVAEDRVRAHGLRTFAAEAAAAGIPVICLPGLPLQVALPVIDVLASGWRETPEESDLQKLALQIQREIASQAKKLDLEGGPSAGALALEVTLFLPDEQSLSTLKEA